MTGRIPSDLIGEAIGPDDVAVLTGQAERDLKEYLGRLESLKPFNGLYLRFQPEQRLSPSDHGASYALEWEAFEGGWRAALRDKERAKNEREIQARQLMRDMQQMRTDEAINRVQRMRNHLMARLLKDEVKAIRLILRKRWLKMQKGYATREEVAELEFKLRRAEFHRANFQGAQRIPIPQFYADLLKHAGDFILEPYAELYEQAVERSHEHRLQTLFAKRSEFYPAWKDHLSLRTYLEWRKGFDEAKGDALVGIRLRLPLDRDSGRDRVVELERNFYLGQQKAIEARIAQKITTLIEQIHLKQSQLRTLEEELKLFQKQMWSACKLVKKPVSALSVVPERKLDDLFIQAYEKVQDLYTLRFEIVAALVELAGVVQSASLDQLFDPSVLSQKR